MQRKGRAGVGVANLRGDAGRQLSGGPEPAGRLDGVFRAQDFFGSGRLTLDDRRGLGEAVALLDRLAETGLESRGQFRGQLFRAGDDQLEGGELFGLGLAQVAAKEGGRGDQEGDLVLLDDLGVFKRYRAGLG